WNLVGDPFLFPIAWKDVGFDLVRPEPPVAWDPATLKYRDADVDTLSPFEGYWIRNPLTVPLHLFFIPHPGSAPATTPAALPAAAPDSLAWQVRIAVTCGRTSDGRNAAGVSALGQGGDDALDRSDPPLAPGEAVSLYFVDPEHGARRRTVDFRAPL